VRTLIPEAEPSAYRWEPGQPYCFTGKRRNYILIHKQFVGKKPQTTYTATVKGRKAFIEHFKRT